MRELPAIRREIKNCVRHSHRNASENFQIERLSAIIGYILCDFGGLTLCALQKKLLKLGTQVSQCLLLNNRMKRERHLFNKVIIFYEDINHLFHTECVLRLKDR